MKTIEEWKKTIDEIAQLKDNFLSIKKDSEELFVKAREIALSGVEDAKELMVLSKASINKIVSSFLGQGDLKSKAKSVKASPSEDHADSDKPNSDTDDNFNDSADLNAGASKMMNQKRTPKINKSLNTQN